MTRQTPAYDPHWPFVTSSSCCRHAVIMSSVYRRRDVAYRRHFVAMLSSGPNPRHNPPVTLAFTRKPGAHVFIEFSCNVIIYINLYYKLIHINLLIRLIINCPSHQKWASANINGKPLFWTFSESDQMSHCFFWLRKTVKDSLRSLSRSEHIAIICAYYWEYNLTRALSRQCPAISLLYPNLFRRPPLTCGDPVSKSIPNDWLLTINEGNSSSI